MSDKKVPEIKIATKAMIEQLFDDAAALYDQAGPSIDLPPKNGASINVRLET